MSKPDICNHTLDITCLSASKAISKSNSFVEKYLETFQDGDRVQVRIMLTVESAPELPDTIQRVERPRPKLNVSRSKLKKAIKAYAHMYQMDIHEAEQQVRDSLWTFHHAMSLAFPDQHPDPDALAGRPVRSAPPTEITISPPKEET